MGVVAPWCLGMGLVVSFTADAGQDSSIGASQAIAAARAPAAPFTFMPPASGGLAALFPVGARVHLASVHPGDVVTATPDDAGDTPRSALKRNAHGWPTPDRSHKGDPSVGLRPTFDAKFRQPGGLAALRARDLLLNADDSLAFDGFSPMTPAADAAVEPASTDDESGAATPAAAEPDAQTASTPTLRAASRQSPGVFDGATPGVPRAVALGSTTPAEADQTPIEIVAVAGPAIGDIAAKPAPNATIVERNGDKPGFADLAEFEGGAEERCLAQAVYFEARSEPEAGQAAVAQVVLNRVKSGLYPPTICGVVYQNRQRRNACQFSFACEGKALRVTEPEAWATASEIAHKVLGGDTYLADVGGATHYHADYVRPRWARALQKMDTIGHHVFYSLRPGQT